MVPLFGRTFTFHSPRALVRHHSSAPLMARRALARIGSAFDRPANFESWRRPHGTVSERGAAGAGRELLQVSRSREAKRRLAPGPKGRRFSRWRLRRAVDR